MVEGVTLLLQGRAEDLFKTLKREMDQTAKDLRFEEAARIRDLLAALDRTLEAQNVSFFHLKDQDVIALAEGNSHLFVVAILSFRKGNLLSGESFVFLNPALDAEEVLASSIKQYYGSGGFVPKEVLVSLPIEQPQLIETWLSELRGNKVTVRLPLRGQGERLMRLALKNAEDALFRETQKDTVEKALERIAAKLHLPSPPRLIEGYDISNISGSQPVGVKVSFRDGQPDKSAYRQYKIRGFPDQDDPGMIHQTITRRVSHREQEPLPDLFLIDGGKSQLNAASQALRENPGDEASALVAIAKARGEGEEERFYLPNRKNPVVFPKGDSGLLLLMRVRDEAHRFAHKSHTKSRAKAVISSALDQIPGIGPKKRQALLTAFGSVKDLLAAADKDIEAVSGIGHKDVERIRAHFKQKRIGLTA
jgi:excinuclease ABC subunit C